jgi:hypothetical protein
MFQRGDRLQIMLRKPVAHDVYVDDFISLIRGGPKRRRAVQRNLFHTLDKVFRPLEAGDNLHRQEPIFFKKLLKGDTHWATTKTILGWDVNTESMTITLPPHRLACFTTYLTCFHPLARASQSKNGKSF